MASDPLRNRFPYDLLLGFVLLLAMVGGSFSFARQQAHDTAELARLVQRDRDFSSVIGYSKDAETGQRGYLLTRSESYLATYEDGRRNIDAPLNRLSRNGDPQAVASARRLRALLRAQFAEFATTIALARAGDHEGALRIVRSHRGRDLMTAIRREQSSARQLTRDDFDRLAARATNNARWLIVGLVVGLFGVLLVATITLLQYRRQIAAIGDALGRAGEAYAGLLVESNAREQAEEQLRQIQKMEVVGQLTGGIAHDFNNMLAIVIGSLDMAQRRIGDTTGKLDRCLAAAREGAERAAGLTARLLAFSRQQPLAPVTLDANRLVADMSELLRRTLGEQIVVETVLAGGLWPTFADSGQLENALLNLAVNARDAIIENGDGGRLTIETANAHLDEIYALERGEVHPGQYVMIGVTDTGVGMTSEVVAKAFEPFFTTKATGKGTGLGLSQVFGFAKQSGGHVAIYSEVGEGTTVKLYLPRAMRKAEAAAPAATTPEALPRGRLDEIILVVEDEDRVRHFSVEALRELGYTVVSASRGKDALEMLELKPAIALLFTDIVMPEMNGKVLSEQALATRPDLKVLYTTGYTRNAVVHNGMLDAGVAFLPKPFTIAQLAVKVREVLDGGGINRPL